jgi:hypothetical protein
MILMTMFMVAAVFVVAYAFIIEVAEPARSRLDAVETVSQQCRRRIVAVPATRPYTGRVLPLPGLV